jgi:hypothetical protein
MLESLPVSRRSNRVEWEISTMKPSASLSSQRRTPATPCIDPVVGDILSGWRYDISGLSPAMRTDYEDHLHECGHCRSKQRLHRTVDVLLISVSSLSILACASAAHGGVPVAGGCRHHRFAGIVAAVGSGGDCDAASGFHWRCGAKPVASRSSGATPEGSRLEERSVNPRHGRFLLLSVAVLIFA